MSQVNRVFLLISTFIFPLAILYGCGDVNPEATFNPLGGHTQNWIAEHGSVYASKPDSCERCHGGDLRGGISKVSCFMSEYKGSTCHANGPGHPAGWAEASQHGVSAERDFDACKVCHGTDYNGSETIPGCYQCHNGPGLTHPAAGWVISDHKTSASSNISACTKCHGADYQGGGSHVACSSCHMESESKVHITVWYPDVTSNHGLYVLTNDTSGCSNIYCHGSSLEGVTGPSCSSCHAWPITGTTCLICHGTPPSGTVFPDKEGAHTEHSSLANVNCAACHLGAGYGTILHRNDTVDVAMNTVYYAKSGAAAFSGGTCTKVSCHGGQTAPQWLAGAININTDCSLCHASGTTEYNSYNSGEHNKHDNEGIACAECHDTAKLAASHFTGLETAAFTSPELTLLDALNYTGTTCTLVCHDKNHNNLSW